MPLYKSTCRLIDTHAQIQACTITDMPKNIDSHWPAFPYTYMLNHKNVCPYTCKIFDLPIHIHVQGCTTIDIHAHIFKFTCVDIYIF